MAKIVLLDPDPTRRPVLAAALAEENTVSACADETEAARLLSTGADVLVADSDAFSAEVLQFLRRRSPTRLLTLLAGEPHPSLVDDDTIFLAKPFEPRCIARALKSFGAPLRQPPLDACEVRERPTPFAGPADEGEFDGLGGPSAAMQRIANEIKRYAQYDHPVLILGESGTGKEIAARRIHRLSRRAPHPFIAINCAGLGEDLAASQLFGTERGAFTGAVERRGAMEEAGHGTIFLDELGEMRLSVQALLLRAIEEHETVRLGGGRPRPFNARIITATHAALGEDGFRLDLLARLEILILELPPLRERLEDIPWLAERFLREEASHKVLSSEALNRLMEHAWPGNVRELRHALSRASVAAGDRELIAQQDIRHCLLGRRSPIGRPL